MCGVGATSSYSSCAATTALDRTHYGEQFACAYEPYGAEIVELFDRTVSGVGIAAKSEQGPTFRINKPRCLSVVHCLIDAETCLHAYALESHPSTLHTRTERLHGHCVLCSVVCCAVDHKSGMRLSILV